MTAPAHGKFSNQRLLIVGCGYVGSELARRVSGEGMRVIALTRNRETAARLQAQGIQSVAAEVADEGWYERVGDVDFVVNTLSGGGGDIARYRATYLGGMEAVLRWTANRPLVRAIVYTGSTSVYPQGGGASIDETAPVAARDERTEILIRTERALLDHGGDSRAYVLRVAGIYGPDRHHVLDQVRTGMVAGYGDHHLNVCHRDDIAGAISALLEATAAPAGIYNVVDDEPSRKADVVRWLARALQVSEPSFSGTPTPGRRAITPDRIVLNTKLKATLGWRPRYPTFREGYAAILAGLGPS